MIKEGRARGLSGFIGYRRSNNCGLAVDAAGYRIIVVEPHIRNNLAFDPGQGSCNLDMLRDSAVDIKKSFTFPEDFDEELAGNCGADPP